MFPSQSNHQANLLRQADTMRALSYMAVTSTASIPSYPIHVIHSSVKLWSFVCLWFLLNFFPQDHSRINYDVIELLLEYIEAGQRVCDKDPTKTHWWPTHPLGNHRPETILIGLWAICSRATRSRCRFGLPAAQQQGMRRYVKSYQGHETIHRGLAWWRLPKCMSAWGEIHSSVIQAVAWSPRVFDLMFLNVTWSRFEGSSWSIS